MKIALNATLLALTLAFGSAHAADAKPVTSDTGTPAMIAGDVVKAEAEVVGIDKKTRTVTLKGEDGNVFARRTSTRPRSRARGRARSGDARSTSSPTSSLLTPRPARSRSWAPAAGCTS